MTLFVPPELDPTLTHHLALVIAVARARNTGKRQRVMRCRAGSGADLCPCNRWTIGEAVPPADAPVDLALVNPGAVR